jgi:hypothetical protein
MKVFLTLISLLLFHLSFSQNQDKYSEYVQKAWSSYEAKEYKKSAKLYNKAFEQLDGLAKPTDRYNAACSYALVNNTKQSFYHLFLLAEHPDIKYRNLSHITNDTDLNSLHGDDQWERLIDLVKANKQEFEKDIDKPLAELLNSIYEEDQKYRIQLDEIEKEHGWNSEEVQAHWKIINEKDSMNLIKVKRILDERGWLGPQVVGDRGNSTLFLVIQHSDLETQLQYLPMMREAVKVGNARAGSLALLEDRVALGQGNKQVYGSQIGMDPETGEYYVLPLEDPESVNDRRAEVGLGTIEEYISIWGMTWDVEKHKARTEKADLK